MSKSKGSIELNVPIDNGGVTAIDNLWQLVEHELCYVEESFEAAKDSIDKVLIQTNKARTKFDILLKEGKNIKSEEEVYDLLRQLKNKVSNLKSKIPHYLINPSLSDQLSSRNGRRRHAPRGKIKTFEDLHGYREFDEFHYFTPPTYEKVDISLRNLHEYSINLLWCYMSFPDNVVIKKSLLSRFWEVYKLPRCDRNQFDHIMDDLIKHDLIKPVYKNSTSSIASYRMHPSVRSSLTKTDYKWPESAITTNYLSHAMIDEPDTLYIDPQQFITDLKVLHLGKWHRSLSRTQHIEVTDPNLFFKGMEKLIMLEYISLQGISMIIELPSFITKLKKLKVLDLKACHNLEIIPNNVYKLGQTLTHLDMSECYFIEHMPKAISSLYSLCVLKGFFIGKSCKKDSCTLEDLSNLSKLQKLNIYTNKEGFPDSQELQNLQVLVSLRNLTISWGGCQANKSTQVSGTSVLSNEGSIDRECSFSFQLEKLDLQCVPDSVTSVWLNPAMFKKLKKLYIRGGQFADLGQVMEDNKMSERSKEDLWTVEILRLRYLSKLKMDWSDVRRLFPNLIRLEKVECPNLTSFHCDVRGIWKKSEYWGVQATGRIICKLNSIRK